jgi:hypothetical protein
MTRVAMKSALAVFVILSLFFALEAGLAFAQEKIKFAFKQTHATVKSEALEIGDVKGHYAGFRHYEGAMEVIEGPKVLEGAQITGVSLWDLIQGNGSAHGYTKAVKGPNSVVMKWQLQVVPSTLPDGTPVTTYEGPFTFTNGTGEFENIRGGGTAKGKYISRNISITEPQGEYWIKK